MPKPEYLSQISTGMHYSEKGAHRLRREYEKTRRAFNIFFPGTPFLKPLEPQFPHAEVDFQRRRLMRRPHPDGRK